MPGASGSVFGYVSIRARPFSGASVWECLMRDTVYNTVQAGHGRNLRPISLDLDTGGFRTRQGVELLHPHTGGFHAWSVEAGFGDAFGQRFSEVNMPCADNGADALLDT